MRGAKVDIFRDGDPDSIGGGIATWPDEWFDLLPGVQLQPGEVVRARQQLKGRSSRLSADDVQVIDRSPTMPQFAEPLVACASLAVLRAVTPGAAVTVEDGMSRLVGQSSGGGTRVVVALNRPVGNGEQLTAHTDACGGGTKGTAQSLPAEPMGSPTGLEAPTLVDEPLACMRLLRFVGTRAGATLVLERDIGTVTFECSAPEMHGRLDPQLVAKETITFWQVPPDQQICDTVASRRTTLAVSDHLPQAPYIVTPPCPGSEYILIEGLVPSARVTVIADGEEIALFDAASASQEIDVSGHTFSPGQSVSVSQSLCGLSGPSSQVPVTVTQPAVGAEPRMPQPLFECAVAVRVDGVVAGSVVSVYSQTLGGRIGRAFALDDAVDVDVIPLINDDTVTVLVRGCSGGRAVRHVDREPVIGPFIVTAPVDQDRSVLVSDLVPGCLVDILVDGRWAGSTPAAVPSIRVGMVAPLRAGQRVEVVIRLCELRRVSQLVTVRSAPPVQWEQPTNGGLALDNNNFRAGRVQAVLTLGGGSLLCGTEASGLWGIGPRGPAISLSTDWSTPLVRSMARGPRGNQHIYCGITHGIMESDPSQLVPLLSWTRVNSIPGLMSGRPRPGGEVADLLVLPEHNVLVAATNRGVWWSPIPATPGTGYVWSSDAAVDWGMFTALTAGPGNSVVAYRRGAPGGGFFRGVWAAGGGLQWTDTTPGANGQAPADMRLAHVVARMGFGDLASCAADRSRMFAALHDTSDNQWLAVLRSDDGGASWSIPYSDPALTFFKIGGTIELGLQADRNLVVGVHPLDRQLVLLASRRSGLLGSTDGGVTWDVGRWPVPDLRTFHADSLCLTFDPEDPSGNTVVVGSDGGIFVSSDVGVTWDSSYNARFPTLMFVQEARSTAPALSASSRFPGLLVGSLQDNGNVYLTQPGENWQELFDGGDGLRALFVTGDVVLRGGNDAVDLKWSRWTGAGFTDPVAFEPPGFPANTTFMPFLARVPDPRYHDPQGGALMVAVAGDDFRLVGTNNIYGLFDKGAAGATDRFYWKTVGTVPFATTGVGTLTGRVILVGTASTHMYRIDPSTGSVVELTLPIGLGLDGVRWPTIAGGSVAFALQGDTIMRTTNLVTWQVMTSPDTGAAVEVLAVDRGRDPIGLYAAGVEGAWLSRDLGSTWRTTSGLPRRPQANHLEVVDTGAAGRWIHLGTWNWSAWRARLT